MSTTVQGKRLTDVQEGLLLRNRTRRRYWNAGRLNRYAQLVQTTIPTLAICLGAADGREVGQFIKMHAGGRFSGFVAHALSSLEQADATAIFGCPLRFLPVDPGLGVRAALGCLRDIAEGKTDDPAGRARVALDFLAKTGAEAPAS